MNAPEDGAIGHLSCPSVRMDTEGEKKKKDSCSAAHFTERGIFWELGTERLPSGRRGGNRRVTGEK